MLGIRCEATRYFQNFAIISSSAFSCLGGKFYDRDELQWRKMTARSRKAVGFLLSQLIHCLLAFKWSTSFDRIVWFLKCHISQLETLYGAFTSTFEAFFFFFFSLILNVATHILQSLWFLNNHQFLLWVLNTIPLLQVTDLLKYYLVWMYLWDQLLICASIFSIRLLNPLSETKVLLFLYLL